MSRKPPPPYCLSRQHPELAKRSQAQREPLGTRRENALPTPSDKPESPTGKGL